MPTLEEMLNEIDNSPSLYNLTNDVFIIDPETRVIDVPATESLFGVESDQKTERKYFQCPKIVGDNIDLSTMGLRINYENANGDKNSYPVTDMKAEGENITFSWLLGRDVTAYVGTIHFIVCAIKTDDDGVITNEWNTTIAEGISIVGLEVEEEATEEEQTLIEQLIAQSLQKITEMNNLMSESEAKVNEAVRNANTSASNADEKAQEAETAAENANEAAQQVFDEAYILTAETTFDKETTITPTAYGNALIEQIEGDTWQGENPSPENPQHIYGLGDTGYFDGVWKQGWINGETGIIEEREIVIYSPNKILCKPGDRIKMIHDTMVTYLVLAIYRKDGSFVQQLLSNTNIYEYEFQIPNGVYFFVPEIQISTGITPQTAGHTTVLINNKYAIKLETRGKNLIDFDKYYAAYGKYGEYSGNTINLYAIKIGIPKECIGKTLTLSALLKLTSPVSYLYVCADVNGVKKKGNIIRSTDYELSKITFTPQSTNDYIFIDYGSADGTISIKNPQLEIGESATDYVPYQHSLSYLPISSPLYKGDQIVKIGSEYKVRRENGVAVFDGSEDEDWSVSTVLNYRYFINVPDIKQGALYCDKFFGVEDDNQNNNSCFIDINKRIQFVKNEIVNNVSEWKTWLQSNPITVVYKLATPVYEDIDQDQFYSIMAADELTNVSLLGENENLVPTNVIRFPRNEDGAIATTGFAESKKNSILLEEQAQMLEQRVQELEALTLEGE